MELQGTDYRECLRRELLKRMAGNSRYSLRAFARSLKISPTTLSLTLKRKRKLSEKSLVSVCESLGFDLQQTKIFRAMVFSNDGASPQLRSLYTKELSQLRFEKVNGADQNLSTDIFSLIADWYHLALFALLDLPEYKTLKAAELSRWLSRQLGIAPLQAEESLLKLKNLKLIKYDGGKPYKTCDFIKTGDDIPSAAIRQHHKQYFEKALIALNEQDTQESDFSGTVFCIDPDQLPEAKKVIQQFRKKMKHLLCGPRGREVYRLQVGLFRINQKFKKEDKNDKK